MKTILLISPYWREEHRWMVSSVKLAELWQRLGYRVVVLCMGRVESGPHFAPAGASRGRKWKVESEKISETLEIYRVPDFFIPDPWNYGIAFGFSGQALRLARELKPDVIVVNKVLFWSSIALLRLRLAGFRVLLLTDALVGITWWPRARIAKACAAIYAWTLGWLILSLASRVIFYHPQPEKILRRLGILHKCMIIPTGIDPDPYSGAEILRAGENDMKVTYVGRLESVKGVEDFLAAAVSLKTKYSEMRIQVAGWYTPNHPLVEAYKNDVDFLGECHEVADLLARSHIFVLPSYSEGLSNALMEAMASSCACIASDVGGNRFLIQNGVSGFLFPAGDREALASHIHRLIQDPEKREALGKQARKRIEDIFSWEKVGKKYADLFLSWHT